VRQFEDRLVPAVDFWTGANHAVDTSWSDAANWSLSAVPGPGDTAAFTGNSSVQSYTSTVDQGFTVGALSIDASWGGNINVVSPLTFGGNSEWDSGQLNAVLAGGTITNTGTLTINNTSGVVLGGGGTFTNDGTIDQAGAGSLDMIGTSSLATTLANALGAVYDFQADSGIVYDGGDGGVVTNAGTIEKTGGLLTSAIRQPFSNTGGTLDAESGTLQLGFNSTNSGGTYIADAGATLDLSGGFTFSETGTFTPRAGNHGAGTITINDGAFATYGATTTIAKIPADMAFLNTGGAFSVPTGSTLTVNGTVTLNGTSPVVLEGGGTLTLKGTIDQTGGGLAMQGTGGTATTLNIAAGAVYDFQADSGIVYNGGDGGVVTNAGTIEKTGGLLTSAISQPFSNEGGTLDAESGTLQLAANSTNSGGIYIADTGATLDLTGGYTFSETGTFTPLAGAHGAGTMTLNDGAFAVYNHAATIASIPAGMNFIWTGGTLDVPTGDTLALNGTVTFNGTSDEHLSGGGTLTFNGIINQTGTGSLAIEGTNSVATTLIIPKGSIYNFQADSGIVYGGGDGGVVNNAGTVEKTGGVATSAINVGFNNTGGTLAVSDPSGGTLSLAATAGANIGGTFNVDGGDVLDLTGGQAVAYAGTFKGTGAGQVRLSSGALVAGGGTRGLTFSFARTLQFLWNGGTIDTNVNTMTVNSLTVAGAQGQETLDGGGTLNLTGSAVLSGTDNTLSIASGTELVLGPKATLNFQADANIGGYGLIGNAGTLKKTKGTSTSTVSASLDNSGTVMVASGTLELTGTVNQVSNNQLTGGIWVVTSTNKTPATLTISSGSFNTIAQGAAVTLSGPQASFTNLSSLTTNAGTLTLLGSTLTLDGSFTQTATGTLSVQLSYTTNGSQVGQIVSGAGGSVSLAGALSVSVVGTPPVGSAFTLLDDGNSGNAIAGSFAGLPEGATFVVNGMTFQITYQGGDGNDVVITRVS
jgi:hypothetical protein